MTGVAENYVMQKLLFEVADKHRLHQDVIKGPSRRKDIVEARAELIRRAIEGGVSVAHLAHFLRRHPTTIRRQAA